jgi:uncharacterized DUF497 family protein
MNQSLTLTSGSMASHFGEAMEVFGDELSSFVSDPDHSQGEDRFLLFGRSQRGIYLVVSFDERAEIIRIISARRMTPPERKAYDQ